MNTHKSLEQTQLPREIQQGVAEFTATLREKLGDNLVSVILYGSGAREDFQPGRSDVNLLILLKRIDTGSLNRILDPVNLSRRYGLNPLIMTPPDLESNLKVFPIKIMAMLEAHIVLFGEDALKDRDVNPARLRWRCQQEIQNQLMRLRHKYISRRGGLAIQMSNMLRGYLVTLRMILFLRLGSLPPRKDVIATAERELGLNASILQQVQELQNEPEALSLEELEALYGKFLDIVSKTAALAWDLENP